jgi:hypothetical protein
MTNTEKIIRVKKMLMKKAMEENIIGIARSLAAVNAMLPLLDVEESVRPEIYVSNKWLYYTLQVINEVLNIPVNQPPEVTFSPSTAYIDLLDLVQSSTNTNNRFKWYFFEDFEMDSGFMYLFQRSMLDLELKMMGSVMIEYYLFQRDNVSKYLPVFQEKNDAMKTRVKYVRYGAELAEGWGRQFLNKKKAWDWKVTDRLCKRFEKNIPKIEKQRAKILAAAQKKLESEKK